MVTGNKFGCLSCKYFRLIPMEYSRIKDGNGKTNR
jgi:hypothetical protein